MRVQAAPRNHFGWIVERTQCAPTEGARAIEAVDSEGKIRGMVMYDGWTENAVQAHMAVDSPIVWRSLAGPAFSYPFEECGKGIVLGLIPAGNWKSLRMAQRLGLSIVHRIRDGWAKGEDLVALELRKENCRWISQGAA